MGVATEAGETLRRLSQVLASERQTSVIFHGGVPSITYLQ